jgi:hypothetical protein
LKSKGVKLDESIKQAVGNTTKAKEKLVNTTREYTATQERANQ